MNKCPSCDRVIKSHNCVVCGIQVKVPTSETFPPITWQEIRDHIVERLMIEPQWMIEEEDEFTWWPWQIPQSVFVSSRVELDLDDISETLVRVTIQSILGTALDRPRALEAVADLMTDYPFGSIVVLEDNQVVALSSVALYGRNRTLLSLVHEEALVQATFAQDISAKLVNDGVIGVDHAPHPTEDKDCEWQSAAFGMVGLETALSVVAKAMIETKLMSWGDLVDRMSIAPAKIAGYSRHGQILKVGAAANLTIIDTTANWIVDRNRLASKSKNTPFEGMKLPSQVLHTFLNGNQVLNNGEIVNGGAIE